MTAPDQGGGVMFGPFTETAPAPGQAALCGNEPDGFEGVLSCTLPRGHGEQHEQRTEKSTVRWPLPAEAEADL